MCEVCGWEELISQIDVLLEEEQFRFAESTLEGIREWIVENEHCTKRQKEVVNNIAESKNR